MHDHLSMLPIFSTRFIYTVVQNDGENMLRHMSGNETDIQCAYTHAQPI